MGHKITKSTKYVIMVLVVLIAFFSLAAKIASANHILKTGSMDSYNIMVVFFVFVGSVAFLALSFVEQHAYKKNWMDPEHFIIIVLGLSGLLYSIFLAYQYLIRGG